MANSWSDVVARLRGIVEALAPGADLAALHQRLGSWADADNLAQCPGLPAEAQRLEILDLLARLGERLAALHTAAGSSSALPFVTLCSLAYAPAACLLARLTEWPNHESLSLAQARSFLGGLRLVLGSGSRAMERSLGGLDPAAGCSSAQLAVSLRWQAWCLERSLALAGMGGACGQAFQAAVPPKLLISWLNTAVKGLQCLEATAGRGAGSDFGTVRGSVCYSLGMLHYFAVFKVPTGRLDQETQLIASLFSLAFDFTHECAVALLLPLERRPAQCHWEVAGAAAYFLASVVRQPLCRRVLGVADAAASGSGPGSSSNSSSSGSAGGSPGSEVIPRPVLLWLQSAAQLAQHVPEELTDGSSPSWRISGLTFQLGEATWLLVERYGERVAQLDPAERRRLARLLLPTVLRLDRLLRLEQGVPAEPPARAKFLRCLHSVLLHNSSCQEAPFLVASGLADCLLLDLGSLVNEQAFQQDASDSDEEAVPGWTVLVALIYAVEEAAQLEAAGVPEHNSASHAEAELLGALRERLAALLAARQATPFPQDAGWEEQAAALQQVMPAAKRLASALLDWRRRPEAAAAARLELAGAAAARSCAYLRCANLRLEGGPAAGERQGSLKCGKCKAVWYCDTACSHADWRGPAGHRKTCAALGQARLAERRGQREQGEGKEGQGAEEAGGEAGA